MKPKKILDSVHGYIYVPGEYMVNIVDTDYFQRLRRIEQTSTRAVFPSARHDRFIHSLGVFHLGSKIVDNISYKLGSKQCDDSKKRVFESYRLACLLHDVGHAPFSHTFEDYYSNRFSDIRGLLCKVVDSVAFKSDWDAAPDPSVAHEIMSAIIAVGAYGNFIKYRGADVELVARMIIGLKYSDNLKYSFENSMIDLIHGDVIDADGLDYVCRDKWASGYSTTTIDIERLINGINIRKDKYGLYQLCYTSSCLNEIESVLKVKTFQQYNVINHHKVAYEQKLLVEAMKSAALYHFDVEGDDDVRKRNSALERLCTIDSIYKIDDNPGIMTKNNVNIALPMDDDFVSLMKYVKDDKYVKQWLCRQYILSPLWKSKADFYQKFEHLRTVVLSKNSWIFHDECKKFISESFGIPEDSIWIIRATPKYKENFAEKIKLLVNDEIVNYKDLLPEDVHSYDPPKNEFYYIYVPNDCDKKAIVQALHEKSLKYFFERA